MATDCSVFVGLEDETKFQQWGLYAREAKHPFWIHIVKRLFEQIRDRGASCGDPEFAPDQGTREAESNLVIYVLGVTGPVFYTHAVLEWFGCSGEGLIGDTLILPHVPFPPPNGSAGPGGNGRGTPHVTGYVVPEGMGCVGVTEGITSLSMPRQRQRVGTTWGVLVQAHNLSDYVPKFCVPPESVNDDV